MSSDAHSLSLRNKLCFGFGALPYNMLSNSLSFYIAPFLLEIAGLRPLQISIIIFASHGWDAVTDPLIGFLVSKTNTRFGKLRPWILFSMPFAVVSYMMIWYVPDISREMKTVWYLMFYCLFQTFISCIRVPYTSLTMYLTPSQSERDMATGYRMTFEVIGVLFGALIQGVMITIYGNIFSCDTEIANFTNLTSTRKPEYSKLGEGYLISSGIMCAITIACILALFFGTKEIVDVIEDKDKRFCTALKSVFSHKSYIMLFCIYLCCNLSIQVIQANIALYCKYSIDAGDIYQIILVVLLTSAIVSLPIWNYLLTKIGKKTAYALGLTIFIPCLFAMFYVQKTGWYVYLIALVFGIGIAVNYLLPWSMLPDVIDEFIMKTRTKRESIFYSFFVFFTKLTAGISIAVTTVILDFAGYVDCINGCCVQPESVGKTLRLLLVPGPVLLIVASLVLLWKYPIDENRRKEIKEALDQMRIKEKDDIDKNEIRF